MAHLGPDWLLTAQNRIRTPFFGLRDTPVSTQNFPLFSLLFLFEPRRRLWFFCGFFVVFVVFCGSLCFFELFCGLVFCQALAGPGRPWQALAGHGRPWQAPAGLGRSEPIRTCTLGPSLPFPALDRASCGYSRHQGIGASGSVSFHSPLSV